MSSSTIRVAISGGGVAGACVIQALQKYPHIDAHIFESAPKFKEAGVAFGITRNATAALDLIGPSATRCLERAGGVQMKGVRFSVAEGKDVGALVYEADSKKEGKPTTTIVQRAKFLHELLAEIPEQKMHASKKLERVEQRADSSLVLHFADKSTHDCDILIGADGIHSMVRKIILGPNDPAAAPRNTGWWAIMKLQPYDAAKASFGKDMDIDDAREYSWIGDGVFLLHNILSHGNIAQFSVCGKDEEAVGSDKWQKTLTAEEVRKVFIRAEHPSHLNKGVEALLCSQPEQHAIYLWEHPPARTYIDGPIAIIGDAAHATTPWQGSGGGFCVEDSLIMSTLLGKATSPKEAEVALKVYDKLRRPRTQDLVTSSNGTGRILTGDSEAGLDAEELRKALGPRWDFIVDFDNLKHRDEAVAMLQDELATA